MIRSILLSVSCAIPLLSGAEGPSGLRTTVEHIAAAVVNLRVVTTNKLVTPQANDTSDEQREILALVVDPSGLVITGIAGLDPAFLLTKGIGQVIPHGAAMLSSEVKEVALIHADGTEEAMQEVMRDDALGLAVLRPTGPAKLWPALALTGGSTSAHVLDPCLLVTRTDSNSGHSLFVDRGEIAAEVAGPHAYLLGGASLRGHPSSPVVDADGALLGFTVLRTIPWTKGASMTIWDAMEPLVGLLSGGSPAIVATEVICPVDALARLVQESKTHIH